jgi:hypothetical protein
MVQTVMDNFGLEVILFLGFYTKKMWVLGAEEAPVLMPVEILYAINLQLYGTNILLVLA